MAANKKNIHKHELTIRNASPYKYSALSLNLFSYL